MNFSSLFRTAVVAVALCLSVGTASAKTTTITIDATGYASFGNSVSVSPGVSFSDTYNFLMPSAATGGSSSIISIVADGIDFTNFALMQGSDVVASGFGVDSVTLSDFILTKGLNPYSLIVEGRTLVGNKHEGYAGSIRVSPVPEAQTYAMLLVGLGLLAFTARSRKSNNFV